MNVAYRTAKSSVTRIRKWFEEQGDPISRRWTTETDWTPDKLMLLKQSYEDCMERKNKLRKSLDDVRNHKTNEQNYIEWSNKDETKRAIEIVNRWETTVLTELKELYEREANSEIKDESEVEEEAEGEEEEQEQQPERTNIINQTSKIQENNQYRNQQDQNRQNEGRNQDSFTAEMIELIDRLNTEVNTLRQQANRRENTRETMTTRNQQDTQDQHTNVPIVQNNREVTRNATQTHTETIRDRDQHRNTRDHMNPIIEVRDIPSYIPRFDGLPENFSSFMKAVDDVLKTVPNLPELMKFEHLKEKCPLGIQKEITHFQSTEDCYKNAVEFMKTRFGNQHAVTNSILNQISAMKRATEDGQSIQENILKLQALNMNLEEYNPTDTIQFREQCWEKFHKNFRIKVETTYPTYCLTWTTRQMFQAMQEVCFVIIRKENERNNLYNRRSEYVPCAFCGLTGHRSVNCGKVTRSQKAIITQQMKYRCKICFESDHQSYECDEPRCTDCEEAHYDGHCLMLREMKEEEKRNKWYQRYQSRRESRFYGEEENTEDYQSWRDTRGEDREE